MSDSNIRCDLLIIGSGMAGMCAALFAANRGISTVQVGLNSELTFAAGLLDLLGVHPIAEGKTWDDPWAAIDALTQDIPNHPYARISKRDIQYAFDELIYFFKKSGITYKRNQNHNSNMITCIGTVKPTYAVPQTMFEGVLAFQNKKPCLLVDFHGLKGYSAKQIKQTLADQWPDLHDLSLTFPGTSGEVYPIHLAKKVEELQVRMQLIKAVQPHVKNIQAIGFPSILGLMNSEKIIAEMESLLGVPVFEIPTMPPSVPGIRMKTIFETELVKKGVRLYTQHKVLKAQNLSDKEITLQIEVDQSIKTVCAKKVILASGRFFGKGLHATRKGIFETIFDLPVYQPGERKDWFNQEFFDSKGHQIHTAGLETDNKFRPLNEWKRPANENLFAAGTILAHQDWMRMKCGSGLSIASAYAAVKAAE